MVWKRCTKPARYLAIPLALALPWSVAGARGNAVPPVPSQGKTTVLAGSQVEVLMAPRSMWPGPVQTKPTELIPSLKTVKARIEAIRRQPEVAEPVVLRLNTLDPLPLLKQLAQKKILDKLAQPQTASLVTAEFQKKILGRASDGRLQVEPQDLSWIDLEKLSRTLKVSSVTPEFTSDEWTRISRILCLPLRPGNTSVPG